MSMIPRGTPSPGTMAAACLRPCPDGELLDRGRRRRRHRRRPCAAAARGRGGRHLAPRSLPRRIPHADAGSRDIAGGEETPQRRRLGALCEAAGGEEHQSELQEGTAGPFGSLHAGPRPARSIRGLLHDRPDLRERAVSGRRERHHVRWDPALSRLHRAQRARCDVGFLRQPDGRDRLAETHAGNRRALDDQPG